MLNLYYANQLANQKEILVKILAADPNPNPFAMETILVQSIGMAQWLQLQIAESNGIAANLQFPYPTSFLWQQYRLLFPELPKENLFERSTMVWRLMRLIPKHLHLAEFAPLSFYLQSPDQLKLYQLAAKIADLFDQYLVYRPHWLIHWEQGASGKILAEICQSQTFRGGDMVEIEQSIIWQGRLWNALVEEIKSESDELVFNTSHRAYLQQRYFDKLDNLTAAEQQKLPPRIFVFGISALPMSQLAVLKKLSEYCQVHLFFTNPSEVFWGDQREDRILEKLALNQALDEQEIQHLLDNQGNPLLATWGKQGKEFLNLILEQDPDAVIPYYDHFEGDELSLLEQVKQAILQFEYRSDFKPRTQDHSIQIHACHSKMREVEVLHDQLLHLFEQDPDLSPKDIIVMSADIDSYAPYIDAVFSRYDYTDRRHIPFALSDQKISYVNPIISSFLTLLSLKEARFSVEEILDLFNVPAIREKYQLSEGQLAIVREWIEAAGIRAGLQQDNSTWQNYNSWENGLNRLLLGSSLKAENGIWQSVVAFDESYGLNAELTGILVKFIDNLTAWQQRLQQPQPIEVWQSALMALLENIYLDDTDSSESLLLLSATIERISTQIQATHFDEPIDIEVLAQLFEQQLSEQRSNLNFLVGKVNFCTLLPMRAIPFKVVCLLGMNEGEFPRQQHLNSFDLMQYAHQKGDRAKRDDDRYLFLEALLSAQQTFYISYIGRSLTDNQEKLPSILVSQLLDYLHQNLGDIAHSLVQTHPMTPFSPHNFCDGHFSYNEMWLQATTATSSLPFLSQLEREAADIPSDIHLDSLISYLQDPYRFFFRTQLGVKFEQYDEVIEESEPFRLNGLSRYDFLAELLSVNEAEQPSYFEQAKLKGNLPACEFGNLTVSELRETIRPLQTALMPYLQQTADSLEFDHTLVLGERAVRLYGQIPHQFGTEVVGWRVGDLRDQDLIRAWLHFILLQMLPQPYSFKFYYRQGKEAKCLTFNPITTEQAEQLLVTYLKDYLSGFMSLSWVVNQSISGYLQENSTAQPDIAQLEQWLSTQENPYLQRILIQGDKADIQALHQRTQAWFGLMVKHAQFA